MADRHLTEETVQPDLTPDQQQLLDRYVDAFWRKDIDTIVSLLTAEAVWEMPPFTGWYLGADTIGRLIDTHCPGGCYDMPMLATGANGQPAFGLYMRTRAGDFVPFQLQVLEPRRRPCPPSACSSTPPCSPPSGLPASLPADARPRRPAPASRTRGEHELDGAVGSSDRVLGYTRVALADVTDDVLARPTPCSEWTLGELLAQMEDALDAFIEAAAGVVRGVRDGPVGKWGRRPPAQGLHAAGGVEQGHPRGRPGRRATTSPAACSSPPPPGGHPCTAGTSGRPRVAAHGSRRTSPATCSAS